jgi:DNA-binding response OmpR family regulator
VTATYHEAMASVLLVEDDAQIGRSVHAALSANGHDVAWVQRAAQAREAVAKTRFDLALLDLGLPDGDGVDVCRELRLAQPSSIIVMLTARRAEMDVVVGLEAGADDYLTKPFGLTELLARVRAHLRRNESRGAHDPSPLEFGDLHLDVDARRVFVRGVEVQLRAKEFELLARLARDLGRAVSRERLMYDVWDENWFGSTKTLDVHIAALRRKLQEAGEARGTRDLPVLTTLRGHGYRLDPPSGSVDVDKAREPASS